MKNTTTAIFLDLDETLAHSIYVDDEDGNDIKQEHWSWRDTYEDGTYDDILTFPRPHAKSFTQQLRDEFEHVYILTAGTKDYAQVVSDHFEWGFGADYVIGREAWYWDFVARVDTPCNHRILVDNENPTAFNARKKMRFLDCDGKTTTGYVQIKPFSMRWDGGGSLEDNQRIFNKVYKEIQQSIEDQI